MRILGITLARGGSKGLPGKNIANLMGKPMLAYTIEEALKSKYITNYIVSSDDDRVLEIAKEYGANTLKRPRHLAQDDTPTWDAIKWNLDVLEKNEGSFYDIVADLRCTNPLKTVSDIDGAIEMLIKTGADNVIGVREVELDDHFLRYKRMIDGKLVDAIASEPSGFNRQDLRPMLYLRNGSVYITRRIAFIEGIHIGNTDNTYGWVMPPERSINVDTELDLLLVETLMGKRNE